MQGFTGTAHGEITIPDPSQGNELVGKFMELLGIAAYNDDFKTVMMVHMDMGG